MDKPSPKVSIIIPVYNTADFVREAIESILNQTLQDLEVIAVNDGSTDGTLEILQAMASEDSRVKILSQKNQGQSIARNEGIRIASGKYFYFMDSDDFLKKEALQACFDKCEANNLDFLFFDADILNKESDLSMDLNYSRKDFTDETTIYNGTEILNILVSHWAYSASPCLSFIRTDYFNRINLSFYPGIIHEDQLFTVLLYLQAQRVMCIHQAYFLRRFRSDSTMTRKYAWRNMIGYITVTRELIKYQKDKDINVKGCLDRFLEQMMNAAIRLAYSLPLNERLRICTISLREFRRYINTKTYLILLFKSVFRK